MNRTAVLILLILLSCNSSKQGENEKDDESSLAEASTEIETSSTEKEPFYFLADSAYLHSFKLEHQNKVKQLRQPLFAFDEGVYELLKAETVYHEVQRFQISENMFGRIIYAEFPSMELDGTMKIFFLSTYNSDDTEIANIRLAKEEEHSDMTYLETAEVHDFDIKRKIKFIRVSDDGSVVEKVTEEAYKIEGSGKISKI